MIITSNLIDNSSGATNPIFAGCCGLVEIKVKLNTNEPTRSIHRIHINNTGGCSTQILSVDGVTWTNPLTYTITLNSLNEITCLVQVCSDCDTAIGHITSFQFEVHWNSPGSGSQTWDFDMINIDPVTNPIITQSEFYWHPCLDDCTKLQGDFFRVNNPTPFTVNVGFSTIYIFTGALNWYIDGVLSGTGTGVSLPIPPGEHEVGLQICPLDMIDGDSISFDVNNCGETYNVIVYYQPVYCGDCGISCRSLNVYSDGNWVTETGYCGTTAMFDRLSIGANVTLQWSMTYVNLQAGLKIYFNPVLFDINCNYPGRYGSGIIDSAPPAGWFFDLNSSGMIGGTYSMTLFGAGVNANSQKNLTATIQFVDNTNFVISLNFFMIEDIENWIDGTTIANQPKLLNSHISAPTPLTNTIQSVYNSNKNLCLLTYITDSNVQTIVNGSPVDFSCYLTNSIAWTSRFWNSGLYGGASEFTNPQFKFKRNGVFVPNLSTVQQTQLIFEIDSANTLWDCYIMLIDTNNTDNTTTFPLNYDMSRISIPTDGTTNQLNGLIYAPSTLITNVGGSTWRVECYIDNSINPNGQWRIGAIVYGSNGLQVISNSFISDVIEVTQIPGIELCCSLNYSNTWNDYSMGFVNQCFAPTMKERIQNQMQITGGAFNTCLTNLGMPGGNSWIDYLKKVTLNIYRIVNNYPSSGQTTFFYFDSLSSNRIAGFPGNWQNNNSDLIVSDDGSTLSTEWNGRVRYESNLPISNGNVYVATTSQGFTRNPAGALASTYISVNNANFDWADLDVYFEYAFEFDLSPIYGQPCDFVIIRNNKIHPVDFETNPQPYTQMLKSISVKGYKNGTPTTIVGPFCDGQFDYLLVEVQQLVANDYTFVALLDRFPYGVGNLLESNGATSATGLTQLSNPEMFDVDPAFSGGSAFFKIDLSLLTPGKYQICGVQLKKP
jgi:hypothetical protein